MRHLVLVAGLLLAFPVAAGAGDVLINNGLDCSNPGNVIDHVTYQSDIVFVRNVGCGAPDPGSPCPSPGDATEVCVEVGGDVGRMKSHDSSVIVVKGGRVDSSLVAHDSSTVAMSGGDVGSLDARDFSTITMDGGQAGTFDANESSSVTLNGGDVSYLSANLSSTATVNGGSMAVLRAFDSAAVTVTGGEVSLEVTADGSSTLTMRGGDAGSYLTGWGSSTVTVSGGTVEYAQAYHSSTLRFVGNDFAVDGIPVPYGDLSAESGVLTGRLASGEPTYTPFDRAGGTITLAFAPAVPTLSKWGCVALVSCLIGFGVVYRRGRR